MNLGMQHVSARKRLFKNLAQFPHPAFWKGTLDRSMYVVGLMGPAALIPQVLQLYQTHDVASISLISWIIVAAINSLWVLYGYLHKEWVLVFANGASTLVNIAIVAAVLLYG